MTAGVLLILTPEPTMLTKVGGTVLTVHGTDLMQAAVRQLFSGKSVQDMTQQGTTWVAHQAGASDQTAAVSASSWMLPSPSQTSG